MLSLTLLSNYSSLSLKGYMNFHSFVMWFKSTVYIVIYCERSFFFIFLYFIINFVLNFLKIKVFMSETIIFKSKQHSIHAPRGPEKLFF